VPYIHRGHRFLSKILKAFLHIFNEVGTGVVIFRSNCPFGFGTGADLQ
jgi:hypothetical protein